MELNSTAAVQRIKDAARNPLEAIHRLAQPHSQVDPQFQSPLLYTRLSAAAKGVRLGQAAKVQLEARLQPSATLPKRDIRVEPLTLV